MCTLFLVERAGRFCPTVVCQKRLDVFKQNDWPTQVLSQVTVDQVKCILSVVPFATSLVICDLCDTSLPEVQVTYRDIRYFK